MFFSPKRLTISTLVSRKSKNKKVKQENKRCSAISAVYISVRGDAMYYLAVIIERHGEPGEV